jgi:hypothetical protein
MSLRAQIFNKLSGRLPEEMMKVVADIATAMALLAESHRETRDRVMLLEKKLGIEPEIEYPSIDITLAEKAKPSTHYELFES